MSVPKISLEEINKISTYEDPEIEKKLGTINTLTRYRAVPDKKKCKKFYFAELLIFLRKYY